MQYFSRKRRLLAEPESSGFDIKIDLDKVISAGNRQWHVIVVVTIAMLALGVAYLFFAVPRYTSTASLLIDSSNRQIVGQLASENDALSDDSSVLSQVEILKSEKIAVAVVERLNLRDNAVLRSERTSGLGTVISAVRSVIDLRQWFAPKRPPTSLDQQTAMLVAQISRNLAVERVGRSLVLSVSYTSTDAQLAAEIAKAYADAYLVDQLDSKYDATRRASDWLLDRIGELKQKSVDADLAVQKFKAAHGLFTVDGELISDKQLSELNSQLVIAQADLAKTEAKYARLKSIIDSGSLNTVVNDALTSQLITGFREKYLEASRREADIASRLGEGHVQAVRLRTEMDEYKRLMFEELSRIASSSQNELRVARQREANLEQQVQSASKTSETANKAQVQLRELQRESESYKQLYQTFLQRYQEALQQQSFPITDARIISRPQVPGSPSSPKFTLVIAAAAFLGMVLGVGTAGLREFRDRFFRNGDQIREELDLEYLGNVPLLSDQAVMPHAAHISAEGGGLSESTSHLAYVVKNPLTPFAETLRNAKLAVDVSNEGKSCRVVGILSTLPGEGKTTIAINFADLLASQGSKVLLIDADLRNPGATRLLGDPSSTGLVEVLQKEVEPRDAIVTVSPTQLTFLPASMKRRVSNSADLLASKSLGNLLSWLREHYDYIIFDLPPLAPVIDSRAIASKMDAFVYVVEWGKTTRSVVRRSIEENDIVSAKCVGALLSKVDRRRFALYQGHGSRDRYMKEYDGYYTFQ